jgi:deoxyribose-phosphate aldolase
MSNRVTQTAWEQHISECFKYQFHAAMIPPAWVQRTVQALRGTQVRTASWIDVPFGTMTSRGKAQEAALLVEDGVEEIDLLPNLGFLLSGMEGEYLRGIQGVVQAAGPVPVKVILELPLLTPQQCERAVALSLEAGAAYLKNISSGSVGIASPQEMQFLRRLAPPHIHIKASGGIKSAQQVSELLAAGADLVGTSAAVRIMQDLQNSAEQRFVNSGSY